MSAIVDMNEFLLWSNCSNNCKFCWQKKISNPECILNSEEKINAINKTEERINQLQESDVLIVGGEVFEAISPEVTSRLIDFFDKLAVRCEENKIRYLYINTNLIYDDLTIIDYICNRFHNISDKLKFTTSYDLEGRFSSKEREDLFLNNLKSITERYPYINIVVNTILTKQVCRSDFSVKKFMDEYKVRLVNLIPYIPIFYGDPLTPTFGEIINKLKKTDDELPGYFKSYIENFDLDQKKILWEYHKSNNDYTECTADYNTCGHNVNFTKILGTGECFICKLKEMYYELS